HRAWSRGSRYRARVRTLLPARALRAGAEAGNRPRARDRQGADARDGRQRRGAEHSGQADHLHRAPGPPGRRARDDACVKVSCDDVERARVVVEGRLHRTPTFSSQGLGVSLKAELFQKTGSFKARGALNRVAALTPEERTRGVVTWSAGNHAQAVAWAAVGEGVD